MFGKRVATLVWLAVASAALLCGPGCSVLVQNRYSVFGLDVLQTESAEQAQAWSLGLLGGVAALAAAAGAAAVWLAQRWRRRSRPAEQPAPQIPAGVTGQPGSAREVVVSVADSSCADGVSSKGEV